jgi:hypothetical protein
MALTGTYRVERLSGLLPPWGIAKRIQGDRGVTTVLGVPVASFTQVGDTLIYDWLPVRDRLTPEGDGWRGEGVVGELRFCSFRLLRHEHSRDHPGGREASEPTGGRHSA